MRKKLMAVLSKRKQPIIGFIIGALTTLLVFALILMFSEPPLVLTGLFGGYDNGINSDIIMYRMFPPTDYISAISIESYARYPHVGEFKILPDPPATLSLHESFAPCNGESFNYGKYSILSVIVSKFYGCDENTFNVPDFNIVGLPGYATYLSNGEDFPRGEGGINKNNIITEKITYVPSDATYLTSSAKFTGLQIGEIVLIKAKDFNEIKESVIPCNGQTVTASEYPQYANAIFPNAPSYTVPDLSGQSPIEGAQYCIAIDGRYPFYEYLPAGKMRCKGCNQIVPAGKYCIECGTKND